MEHYGVQLTSLRGATVELRVSLAHPDITEVGIDRAFAWDVLAEVVTTVDEGTPRELAERCVLRVDVVAIEHGTEVSRDAKGLALARSPESARAPAVRLAITMRDASLLAGLVAGQAWESSAVIEGEPIANDGDAPTKTKTKTKTKNPSTKKTPATEAPAKKAPATTTKPAKAKAAALEPRDMAEVRTSLARTLIAAGSGRWWSAARYLASLDASALANRVPSSDGASASCARSRS